MNPSSVVTLNCVLYLSLFIFCYVKYGIKNVATVISILYAFSSVCSLLLYNFPTYKLTFTNLGKPNIEGCLYLFSLVTILILPFGRLNLTKTNIISHYSNNVIYRIEKILIVLYVVYLIFAFPQSIMSFFSGQDLSDLRNDYGLNGSAKSLPFFVILIMRVIGSMKLILLSFIAIRFFLFKLFTRWDKAGVIVYILLQATIILSAVSRATMLFSLIESVILFIIFYNYISKKTRKKIYKFAVVVIPLLAVGFTAITAARFTKREAIIINLANLRYAGEAQLNFINLAYPNLEEPFHGFAQFSLFRRILGMTYDDGQNIEKGTVYNKVLRSAYNYKYPTYIFYSLVGNFYLNWGWWGTIIICILLNRFISASVRRRNISFIRLIAVIVLACYIATGVFFAQYQSEAGNLMILFLFLLGIYLMQKGGVKIRSHLHKSKYEIQA